MRRPSTTHILPGCCAHSSTARSESTRPVPPQRGDLADAAADGDVEADTGDAVVAERVQPAKAHAKAKPKKRR